MTEAAQAADVPSLAWHDAPVDVLYTDAAQTQPFTGTINTATHQALGPDGSLDVTERPRFVAAGKNFGSFDLQFLNRKLNFSEHVRCLHRSIDPAMLYFNPVQDNEPPNMQKCLDRAGIEETVDHTGLADAFSVVKLIRNKVSRQDMAKIVGASREMVSRVMKDLEDRGFIETREDGSMIVKDRLTTLG